MPFMRTLQWDGGSATILGTRVARPTYTLVKRVRFPSTSNPNLNMGSPIPPSPVLQHNLQHRRSCELQQRPYVSLQNSNTNNRPDVSPTYWSPQLLYGSDAFNNQFVANSLPPPYIPNNPSYASYYNPNLPVNQLTNRSPWISTRPGSSTRSRSRRRSRSSR